MSGAGEGIVGGAWIDGFEQISCLGVGAGALAAAAAGEAWKQAYPVAKVDPAFDFDRLTGTASAEGRQMDLLGRFAVACAGLLLERRPGEAVERGDATGVVLGSAFGCSGSNEAYLETLVSAGPRRTSPIVFRNTVSNAAAGQLAVAYRILRSNSVLNSGMVSGAQALAFAFQELATGRCDRVLAGAADWTSGLVRKRFVLQGERYGRSDVPLMEGACLFSLSRSPRGAAAWRLAGCGMGRLDSEDLGGGLVRVLRRALASARVDAAQVDAFQLQTAAGELWLRSEPAEALESVCCDLARAHLRLPFPENTALPSTLALAASLRFLQGEEVAPLLVVRPPVARRPPRHLVYAAVGADGNAVLLVLENAHASRRDG